MENLKDRTTAELLAEWGRQQQASDPFSSWAYDSEYQKEIAAELDRRCSEAGICIIGDKLGYYSESVWWQAVDGVGYKFLDIPAKEQHDLEAWLIQKGGNG